MAYSHIRALEEAKLAVPESTEDSSMSGFGANEWLVDEMYERYQKDPHSVDKVWWDFFD
ncbi:MAG: kgd, partial [Marmoricola sp.]|nr:kgd [Marmoricola sp.]